MYKVRETRKRHMSTLERVARYGDNPHQNHVERSLVAGLTVKGLVSLSELAVLENEKTIVKFDDFTHGGAVCNLISQGFITSDIYQTTVYVPEFDKQMKVNAKSYRLTQNGRRVLNENYELLRNVKQRHIDNAQRTIDMLKM